ncbi:hypothetical protein M422DRAFT_45241 [Sphaerobolus stellatus SS14]|nr:hypothetical protein M422DRAFT_45241 [Sphaerobolus stellatus SS14]
MPNQAPPTSPNHVPEPTQRTLQLSVTGIGNTNTNLNTSTGTIDTAQNSRGVPSPLTEPAVTLTSQPLPSLSSNALEPPMASPDTSTFPVSQPVPSVGDPLHQMSRMLETGVNSKLVKDIVPHCCCAMLCEADEVLIVSDGTDPWTKLSDKLPFRPYTRINRSGQWAVSDEGKLWISQWIPSYRTLQPPGSLPKDEATDRHMTHRKWWTTELVEAYKANWPDFEVREVVGDAPTPAQQKLHDEFIDYALRHQYDAEKTTPADIISLIVQRIQKLVAYNFWAQSNPDVDVEAMKLAMKDERWANQVDHLHVSMEMRKKLFLQLPPLEQAHWEKQAEVSKKVDLTEQDCIALVPKIFGMICDALRKYFNFNCLVLCGGKGVNEKGWYYTEEWRCPSINDPFDFISTDNWKLIQASFLQTQSQETGVKPDDFVQLPTWQQPRDFIPKVVARLLDVLQFDEDGAMKMTIDGARQAVEKHLDALWVLVPDKNGAPQLKKTVPWTQIRQNHRDLGQYVEVARLPEGDFVFDRLKDMPLEDLKTLINHIIKGEKGELPAERVFRWVNQTDGKFDLAPRPCKQFVYHANKPFTYTNLSYCFFRQRTGAGRGKANRRTVDKDKAVANAPAESSTIEHIDLDGVMSSEESDIDISEIERGRTTTRAKLAKSKAQPKPTKAKDAKKAPRKVSSK